MTDKEKKDDCCGQTEAADSDNVCCAMVALVTVDERGQMVLPKEIREIMKIKPGDKLAVTTLQKDGKVCCLSLVPAGEISGMLKTLLGDLIK